MQMWPTYAPLPSFAPSFIPVTAASWNYPVMTMPQVMQPQYITLSQQNANGILSQPSPRLPSPVLHSYPIPPTAPPQPPPQPPPPPPPALPASVPLFNPFSGAAFFAEWSERLLRQLNDERTAQAIRADKHGVTVTVHRSGLKDSNMTVAPSTPNDDIDFGYVPCNDKRRTNIIVDDNRKHTTSSNAQTQADDEAANTDSVSFYEFTDDSRTQETDDDDAYNHKPHSTNIHSSRIVDIDNTLSHPLSLQLFFMPQTSNEHSAHFTVSDPTNLNETLLSQSLVINAHSSRSVAVHTHMQDAPGLTQSYLIIVLTVPLHPHDTSYTFTSTHFVIARRCVAIHMRASHMTVLTREAVPFYPPLLKQCFQRPAKHIFTAPSIRLPLYKAHISLQKYDLPSNIVHQYEVSALQQSSNIHSAEDFLSSWNQYITNDTHFTRFTSNLSSSLSLTQQHLRQLYYALQAEELQQCYDIRAHDLYYTKIEPYSTYAPAPLRQRPNQNDKKQVNQTRKTSLTSAAATVTSLSSPSSSSYVWIIVPGVSEGRPSLIIGMTVIMRLADSESDMEVIAYVQAVVEDRVALSFPLDDICAELHVSHEFIFKQLWHTRFTIDRLIFQYMYRAIDELFVNQQRHHFIMPQQAPPRIQQQSAPQSWSQRHTHPHPPPLPKLKLFDTNLNAEQQLAVQHILARSHGINPYIIFGPPGTGKTLTVVEAIMQCLHQTSSNQQSQYKPPEQRNGYASSALSYSPSSSTSSSVSLPRNVILVCAPSNFACDVLAERLSKYLNPKQMIRLNAVTRHTAVKRGVQPYCYYDKETGLYAIPDRSTLREYRVVICTCGLVGVLVDLAVGVDLFTHIFFDESSQAMETEALIALCLTSASTSVILTGDPKQLGADVHSSVATAMGLAISLQERLMSLPVYTSNNAANITQLTRNYRSHQALLTVSSQLFYGGKLVACAPDERTPAILRWSRLPAVFPLFVEGIVGVDTFEQESGSFYNALEASTIVDHIEHLLTDPALISDSGARGHLLSTADICVIAPYRKQVMKIRQLLRARGLSAIRVGSVDDYQGEEAPIIFISTVISQRRPHHDTHNASSSNTPSSLSILRNPKRFNVAITRAKSLCVVVGNPFVLCDQTYWSHLLEFAVSNRAYSGCQLPNRIIEKVNRNKLLGSGHARTPHHNQQQEQNHHAMNGQQDTYNNGSAHTFVANDNDNTNVVDVSEEEEQISMMQNAYQGAWRIML